MARNDKAIQVLATSTNTRELARAAQQLAASADGEDQAALSRILRDARLRARLDPPNEEAAGADDLNIAQPLRTLASNKSPLARGTLSTLMGDPLFTEDLDRVDLLIRATASWRPADAYVLAFWRRFMDPDGVHAEAVVEAAVENASEPAVGFFEECFRDPRFVDENKIAWMRRPLLVHRVEDPFLRMSERLLSAGARGPLSRPLQLALVEALFDFRQEEWYSAHNPPIPPRWNRTTPAGRDILRRIATYARERLEPSAQLNAVIDGVIGQLDGMDRRR